ncbi:MAG: D-amino-acid transaminase [Pseudomonadota bacterium]
MSRIAYVNGRYLPHAHASVHVEDRGYQFADGVYEVCEVKDGYLIDQTRHLDRLDRSLRELQMAWPVAKHALPSILAEVVRANRVHDGLVYVQVTRGVARRDHAFPAAGTRSALVVTARFADPLLAEKKAANGIAAITVPETRWDRVDIKTVGLLSNVLARQSAIDAAAQEGLFVDENDIIKEGASTNAWIVTKEGVLVTRPAEHGILRGITREGVFDVAEEAGLSVEERGFTVEEAYDALEMFVTSATSIVMPVIRLNDRSIANGEPGSVAAQLRAAFHRLAERTPVYG